MKALPSKCCCSKKLKIPPVGLFIPTHTMSLIQPLIRYTHDANTSL